MSKRAKLATAKPVPFKLPPEDPAALRPVKPKKRTTCPQCEHKLSEHRAVAGNKPSFCYECMDSPCHLPHEQRQTKRGEK